MFLFTHHMKMDAALNYLETSQLFSCVFYFPVHILIILFFNLYKIQVTVTFNKKN